MKRNWKMMVAGLAMAVGLSGAAFGQDWHRGRDERARVEARDWNRDRDWRADHYYYDRVPVRDYRWYGYGPAPVYRGPVYVAPHRGYYDAYGVFHYYPW